MSAAETPTLDIVRGDATGLSVPAHARALQEAGAAFLTEAFHTFGSLPSDNRVARIVRCEPCPGGSTGAKLFLTLEYANPRPDLHTELFVKFSRDFTDPIRDRGRHELEAEVRFAALSRHPAFPISVPVSYFADYHHESGTGVLITSRVLFGSGGVEPHRQKCLDHEIENPLEYYRTLITSLARLAAAHKSGLLSPQAETAFPFDPESAARGDKIPWDANRVRELIARYVDLFTQAPQLFPVHLQAPDFVAGLERDALRFLEHEAAIKRYLHANPNFIALCHWNAHIDNAWFWRDDAGRLQCGLIDWGRVRQLNLAYPLWGCLSGAPLDVWDDHLDELLALFTTELHVHGGPRLDIAELRLHLQLYVATMGLAGMLIAPERILFRLPEAVQASSPRDPLFRQSEQARNFLHIYTNFLNLWRTHDFGESLNTFLRLERVRRAED